MKKVMLLRLFPAEYHKGVDTIYPLCLQLAGQHLYLYH